MLAGEGGGGLAKCLCYYKSLCSKLAYGGGGGQKLAKFCLRSLWIVPKGYLTGYLRLVPPITQSIKEQFLVVSS